MLVFFFKQKTAYELRISDWSSDVCSSDLQSPAAGRPSDFQRCHHHPQARPVPDATTAAQNRIAAARAPALAHIRFQHRPRARTAQPSPRTDRKGVVLGTSDSLRVALGLPRIIKQKKQQIIENNSYISVDR